MKNILITGAAGFVGTALLKELSSKFAVTGTYCTSKPIVHGGFSLNYRHMDLNDESNIQDVCNDIKADVVIHAAAVTERSLIPLRLRRYHQINGEGTARLARRAACANPGVHFIYLSTVDVYGETPAQIPAGEGALCAPSTDYAKSKYRGEKEIVSLYDQGLLRAVTVLRLAPLYDRKEKRILRRRVMAPFCNIYVRYGSGNQRFSALALPNFVAFVSFLLRYGDAQGMSIYNVCDERPYRFHDVCEVLRGERNAGNSLCLPIPSGLVYAGITLAGLVWPRRRQWFRASYRKLCSDRVFDCGRMRKTGFTPSHSLQYILSGGER
ncbi:MAG: sugar nucleotide-binding protein [Syntrophales bacterium]|nr:sugar nucleotide-binding protein [Syntrophales bacterium]